MREQVTQFEAQALRDVREWARDIIAEVDEHKRRLRADSDEKYFNHADSRLFSQLSRIRDAASGIGYPGA